MHFLPYDVNTTEPSQGGRAKLPEGIYLLQMEDATKDATEKNGQYTRRDYKTRVLMGPGWSQEYAGKPYQFGYRTNDDNADRQKAWNGRHMAVATACLGSVEAVRQVAQQHGGWLPGEALQNRQFIAELTADGNFNNISRCMPYTEQTWNQEVGGTQPQPGLAPAPMVAAPPMAPAAPPAYAPPAAPPAFAAPPAPPAYAPPAAPAPAAPAAFTPPAPPPPPGLPASR